MTSGDIPPTRPPAVLCLHGLSSTPYEMKPLVQALNEAGLTVESPPLLGQEGEAALQLVRWADLLTVARRAFDQLAATHERVMIVGSSVGALLALRVAHERGSRVAGVVAMGTPLTLGMRRQAMMRLASVLPLAELIPFKGTHHGPDVSDPAVAADLQGAGHIPLNTMASLRQGQVDVCDRIERLSCPVLVLHGRRDHTAPLSNAYLMMQRLRSPHRRLIIYPQSWHILVQDVEHESVIADIQGFIADPQGFTAVGDARPA
ncbi:MAG: alpha/beta hydrolase [Bradymonadia bacterium]